MFTKLFDSILNLITPKLYLHTIKTYTVDFQTVE